MFAKIHWHWNDLLSVYVEVHFLAISEPGFWSETMDSSKSNGLEDLLVKQQLQYIKNSVLKHLFKFDPSWPFRKPVDTVALKLHVSNASAHGSVPECLQILHFALQFYWDLEEAFNKCIIFMGV